MKVIRMNNDSKSATGASRLSHDLSRSSANAELTKNEMKHNKRTELYARYMGHKSAKEMLDSLPRRRLTSLAGRDLDNLLRVLGAQRETTVYRHHPDGLEPIYDPSIL